MDHYSPKLVRNMIIGEIITIKYYGLKVTVKILSHRPHTINYNNSVVSVEFQEAIKFYNEIKEKGYTTQVELPY